MKKVYDARHAIDAHMMQDLLRQQNIVANIEGEYLTSGIGELPATGLVRVMVAPADFDAASEIVRNWEASAVPSDAASVVADDLPNRQKRQPARYSVIVVLAALALGIVIGWFAFDAPLHVNGWDMNQDGVLDDRVMYSLSGRILRNEIDRNFDGKPDAIVHYNQDGRIESTLDDDDFDSVFESRTLYRNGFAEHNQTDTDGDGFADLKTYFQKGGTSYVEYIAPSTGLPYRIEYFKLGKRTHVELDSKHGNRPDTRVFYDARGEELRREPMTKLE